MTKGIRIYIEGGGDYSHQQRKLRAGFNVFFSEIKTLVREKGIKWHCIPCGGRGTAYSDFKRALDDFPDSFIILLVDSEGEVNNSPKDYLIRREKSWVLGSVDEEQIHLMVQTMEAWFMADKDALIEVFGAKLDRRKLPQRTEVEKIPKIDLKDRLKTVTRAINGKKEYHEIDHGSEILKLLNVRKVRDASPHCDGLFSCLEGILSEL